MNPPINRTKATLMSLALVGSSALIAYPLFAHCGHCAADGKTIVEQLDKGKLTLAKAVSSAETRSKGRAISVISELNDKDQLAMEVFCIVSDPAASSASATPKIMKCMVDSSGNVTDMKEAKAFPTTDDDGEDAHGHDHDGHDHDRTPVPSPGTGAPGSPGKPGSPGTTPGTGNPNKPGTTPAPGSNPR